MSIAQESHPPVPARGPIIRQSINCGETLTIPEGIKSFKDELTGIRFDYPAYLTLNDSSLAFEDPACGKPFAFGGEIKIDVSLPLRYREPYYADRDGVELAEHILNGLKWKHYKLASSVRMCTFAEGEQVCILAVDTSQAHRVPDAAIEAMKAIEESFAFTDPAKRMDAKIAALKVGDLVGSLKVHRVITRAMSGKHQKRYEAAHYESFGEVDFDGELRVTGSIEDIGTMNSRGQYRIFPSSEDGPQLPFGVDRNVGSGFAFDNPPPLDSAVEECSRDQLEDYTFLLKSLRVIVGPRGGGSEVRGDLVSIAKRHRPQ